MDAPLDHAVFAVGDRTYAWSDVVLAARLWGEWAALEAEARLGLACAARADDRDEWPDEDTEDAAANEFRYARDLVSAEEMEAWLARWGLDEEAWTDYIRRDLLRREGAEEADEVLAEYEIEDEDVEAVLWSDAVCSGRLQRWAQELAARAAIQASLAEEAPESDDATVAAEARRLLTDAGADPADPRAGMLARVEVGFRRFVTRAVTPRAIQAALEPHRLDWVRFDGRCLALRDEEMAREAALAVREDGLGLDEVAEQAKTEVQAGRWYLDELPAEHRDRFVAARKGELVGPLPWGEGYALILVVDKVVPSAEDADTRRRAAEAVLAGLLEHEVSRRVTWHSRP